MIGSGIRLRWVGLGLFLLQAAWVVAMPPFAAMDEFDHAYRAAAVAHGQWAATPSEATTGTGAFVLVPTDIVEAAQYECRRLSYGGQDECVGSRTGEFSEVASGAGRYPPTFYALVGWPSRFLDGALALYGMRAVGLVLRGGCSWRRSGRGAGGRDRWRALQSAPGCGSGVLRHCHGSAERARNGQRAALWCALASLAHAPDGRTPGRSTVVLAVVSGTLLLSLRAMGPFWMAMIVAVWLIAWPTAWPRLLELMRSRSGSLAALWLAAVACVSLGWVLSQETLEVRRSDEGTLDFGERLAVGLPETLLWTFQFLGTFPYRGTPRPPSCTRACSPSWWWAPWSCCGARRHGSRWALAALVGAAYAIPMVITVATLERYGTAWQGRSPCPFSWDLSSWAEPCFGGSRQLDSGPLSRPACCSPWATLSWWRTRS